MKPENHRPPSSSIALLIALAASPGAFADTIAWDGNGTNDASGNWSLGDNWDTGSAPGAADTAVLTDVTAGTRVVTFDTAGISPVQQVDFNQATAGATNVLDIQKSLAISNPVALGAAAGTERISIGSTAAASFVLTPSGGLTLDPGGELAMTATGNGTTGYFFGNTGGSGTTTIQGGILTVGPTTGTSSGTSAANTHAGSLTMTSGSLVIDNLTGQQDRRLLIQGAVNITGGAVSSTKPVAAGNLTFSSGSPVIFNPDSYSTNLSMSLDRAGAQSLSTNRTLGNMLFRGTGVKTLTSSAAGNGIGQIQMFDNNGTGGSQTTLKLGSNLGSNAGANMPAAQSFGNTHESGRIDLGIDTNGFTQDLTAGAGSGAWTPNASTQAGVNTTVWNLSGSGVIKANRFDFTTNGVTTNVAANTVLTAAGGNSTATDLGDLGGTGTLDATSTFRYSGAAALATPATLTSNRAIGKLDVTSGTLKLSGTLNAGGTTTVTGGTLLVPLTASLYGGTSASWTAANLNVLSGGTLGFNVGGAGEFATTDVTTLLTSLASSSDDGLRAGATLGFDTTNATGGTFTVADTLADTAGTTGGALGIHKLGTNTLVLTAANSHTGLTTVSGGVLRVSDSAAFGGTAAGTVVNGSVNGIAGTNLDLNGVSIVSGESLTLASGSLAGDSRTTLRTIGTTINTWAGTVLLTGSKTVQFNANTGGQLVISGPITHSGFTGPVTLRGGGTGTLSGGVSLGSATNITFNEATSVWNINTTGNTWGNTNLFRGMLVLGANEALPITTLLSLGGTDGSGTLKLNGRSQTVAGLTTNVTTTTNKVVNGSATAGSLTVNNSTANTFAGTVGGPGADDNKFSLTKSGSGTLTLSGTCSYSGDTTVTEGTLTLPNNNTGNDASTVSIAAGAVLGLNFAGDDAVNKLFLGTPPVQVPDGTYNSSHPVYGAYFSLGGSLEVGPTGTPYDTWATGKGLTGLPGSSTDPAKDADPDKDGRDNLAEFAFNGDPLGGADNGKVFVLTEDSDAAGDPSGAKELILTVAVRAGTPAFTGTPSPSANFAADGITYTIEGSLDLGSFLAPVVAVPTAVVTGLPVAGSGYEYRSFSLGGSDGLGGKGFLRAEVTSP